MSPPAKVVLLILAGISLRIAFTPPNPRPTKGDRVLNRRTLYEQVLGKLALFMEVRPNPDPTVPAGTC
jgi:hypothetical protein